MKIGIIYCGYNQLDNIKNTLTFWNNLKIDNVNFIVSVISVPFLEYKDIDVTLDNSEQFINNLEKNNIKTILLEPKFVKERVARTNCMESLINENLDFLWQVDSDEYYTKENVENILNHLKVTNDFEYSVNFKNYIFDGNHYLDDFCVPKINRVSGHKILSFADDNQVVYRDFGMIRSIPIPKDIALVKHLTWLHKNGKQKVEYQLKHFGDCSYRWNNITEELELDLDYYKRHGYRIPNILKENYE